MEKTRHRREVRVKKEKNKVKEKSDHVEMVDGNMKTKIKMKMEAAKKS